MMRSNNLFQHCVIDRHSKAIATCLLGVLIGLNTAGADTANAEFIELRKYDITSSLNDLSDGDIVRIKNYKNGYLDCENGNNVITEFNLKADNSGTSHYWKVHSVDINNDGDTEFQFENIGENGLTGKYLKMESDGGIKCSIITGIGDAAAWSQAGEDYFSGYVYKVYIGYIKNYKHNNCLKIGNPSVSIQNILSLGEPDANESECDNLEKSDKPYYGFNFEVVLNEGSVL